MQLRDSVAERALHRESGVLGPSPSVLFLKKPCDSGHITTPFSKHGSFTRKMKAPARDDEVQGGAGAAEADRPRLESGFPISGFIVLGKLFNLSEFLLCLSLS